MTRVTHHDIPDDPSNDPEHPIPYLHVIDVSGYRKGDGTDDGIRDLLERCRAWVVSHGASLVVCDLPPTERGLAS